MLSNSAVKQAGSSGSCLQELFVSDVKGNFTHLRIAD